MNIQYKQFDPHEVKYYQKAKELSRDNYKLTPINNVYLILDKIKKYSNTEGVYLECGTYKGNTLLTAALYCKLRGIKTKLIGVDTFEGFPPTKNYYKDLPSYFLNLYQDQKISEYHFIKAKERTDNFTDTSHLESEYFSDVNNIFNHVKDFSNVVLEKGTFEKVLPQLQYNISVLHLDGDLYHSYLTCLSNLYDKVIEGGCIIFDEYFSFKYPGARVAIDEFFQDKEGSFELYITPEGFERWCFTKG